MTSCIRIVVIDTVPADADLNQRRIDVEKAVQSWNEQSMHGRVDLKFKTDIGPRQIRVIAKFTNSADVTAFEVRWRDAGT